MARTTSNLIKSAFRKAGVITKNETPSSDEMNDALESLNDLFGSLSNDGLVVYTREVEGFALTAGVTSYTIGSGGDFDTVRPVNIAKAYTREGTSDYPVDIISDEDYAEITTKSTQTRPYYLNYDNDYPLATIKLYPTPSAGYTLYLVSEKPLTELTLNQTVNLPPGWYRYITNALAIEIAAEYGVDIPQTTAVIAARALGDIKRSRAKVKSLDYAPNTGLYNIYTGWNY